MREDLVSELFVKEWKRDRRRRKERKGEKEREKGGSPSRIRERMLNNVKL